MSDETPLWKGSPSQWLNLGTFTIGLILMAAIVAAAFVPAEHRPLLLIGLVFPFGWMLWRYLSLRCHVFELTSQRLRITTGVINQHIDEIELYRVKDVLMVRPWWMRITGQASLLLETSDRSAPMLTIPAVAGGATLREELRIQVERQRDLKRVRETDFEEGGAENFPRSGSNDTPVVSLLQEVGTECPDSPL